MKTIKVNRYYDKRGNSYATRDEQKCLDIVLKKLKLLPQPTFKDWSEEVDYIMKVQSIEKQVNTQYDCNKREIEFKIGINN